MKLIIAATGAMLILGNCTVPPQPICDREAQLWNKFGTPADLCISATSIIPVARPDRDGGSSSVRPVPRPDRPDDTVVEVKPPTPPNDPPPEKPRKQKSNAGRGNGSEGSPDRDPGKSFKNKGGD